MNLQLQVNNLHFFECWFLYVFHTLVISKQYSESRRVRGYSFYRRLTLLFQMLHLQKRPGLSVMLSESVDENPANHLPNVQNKYSSKWCCWSCLCSSGMGSYPWGEIIQLIAKKDTSRNLLSVWASNAYSHFHSAIATKSLDVFLIGFVLCR